jgi:hypothetical protein
MALTPLLCVHFCNIQQRVQTQRVDLHFLTHDPASHDKTQNTRTPLNDLQALVHAVTDILPVLIAIASVYERAATQVAMAAPHLRPIPIVPPAPPPRERSTIFAGATQSL